MMKPDDIGVQGILTIREFSKETGELLYEYEDKNVITELGMNTLFLRMVMPDDAATMKLKNFFLGIDYGEEEDPGNGWSVFNPKPAERFYTSLNQYVVYEVPEIDMVFDYPEQNSMQVGTLLDGKYILDTFYTDEVDLRYTSATFRFENDTTFSYKRFPVRSLSRLIDVQIVWTFRFINARDYVCPLPDYEALINVYSLENSLQRYNDEMQRSTVDSSTNIADVKVRPNGDLFYVNGSNRLVVLEENLSSKIDRTLDVTGTISKFDLDRQGNILAVTEGSNGRVAKFNSAGDRQWQVSIGDGNQTPRAIWAIDNTRIAVSMEQTGSTNLSNSGNRVYVLNSDNGSVLYSGFYDLGNGQAGAYDLFSSSGGELFVAAKGHNVNHPNSLIKVNYDLTEISRISLPARPLSYFGVHDNFILVGLQDGRVFQYDADLNYIRDYSVGASIVGLSTDRDRNVYVATPGNMIKVNATGGVIATQSTTTEPKSISAVGSKWTYFGS